MFILELNNKESLKDLRFNLAETITDNVCPSHRILEPGLKQQPNKKLLPKSSSKANRNILVPISNGRKQQCACERRNLCRFIFYMMFQAFYNSSLVPNREQLSLHFYLGKWVCSLPTFRPAVPAMINFNETNSLFNRG